MAAGGASLLRTTAARLTILYLVLVAAVVAALLVLVHWLSVGHLARQTDAAIEAEVAALTGEYRRYGLPALQRLVRRRAQGRHLRLYILSREGGPPAAGNLDSWPEGPAPPSGWIDFSYDLPARAGAPASRAARARVFRLPPDLLLLAGRDIQHRAQVERRLETALLGAGGVALLLGFAGGALAARRALARVEGISTAARKIMQGDLSQRLPERGSGDELDQLSGTLNAMMARIEGLMRNLREVTDNIAHDLRTPLTRLRSGLEAALLDADGPGGQRAALEGAIAEADQLIATFNALLEIARLESGARPPAGPVDLAAIVREMAELHAPLAEEAGLALFAHAGVALPGSGVRTLLAQSVSNLLDNAIKHSPAGGSIRVTARSAHGGAEIVVSDDGPGIPESERRRALDRFVRLDSSRDLPGSGLGLSLVDAVVRLHGGTLALEDNAPGLRARILLPGPGEEGARGGAEPGPGEGRAPT